MNCNTACPGIRSDMDLCSITTSSRRTCGRISRGRILITELVKESSVQIIATVSQINIFFPVQDRDSLPKTIPTRLSSEHMLTNTPGHSHQ